MNEPVISKNSLLSYNTQNLNKGDYDEGNETKYDAYPNNVKKINQAQHQSNTGAIITALEKLYSKLRQLQHDRDLANQAVQDLTKQSEKLKHHLLHRKSMKPDDMHPTPGNSVMVEIQSAEAECQAIENNLQEIMKLVPSYASHEPSHPITPGPASPSATVKKLKARKQSSVRYTPSNSSKHLQMHKKSTAIINEAKPKMTSLPQSKIQRQQRHYRLDLKHLPFITSKVPGPSFSLPVNMQLLIASLKTHNPWFCSLTSECVTTKDLIVKVDQDLQAVIRALQNSIECLTLECCELRKQLFLPVNANQQQQRISQLTSHRNILITHMQDVSELEKQLHKLKEHFMAPPERPVTSTNNKTMYRIKDQLPLKPTNNSTITTQKKQKNKLMGCKKTRITHKPWNDQVVITTNVSKQKPSVDTLRYMELLQMALKRNGLRLKPCLK